MKAEFSGGVIVLYQHKGWNSPLHYVAGISTGHDVAGGSFYFYNDNYVSCNEAMSIPRYINYLKKAGCKLLYLICVSGKRLGW